MIVAKAYKGKNFVYRAYKGERLIWDHGSNTSGSLIAALLANAMPQPETPESVLMDAAGSVEATGLARAVGFDYVLAQAFAEASGNTTPRAREAVHAAGFAECFCQALGAAATHGLVFTSGHAEAEGTAFAMPRAVDTVYGTGTAEVAAVGNVIPRMESFLRLMAEVKVEARGWTTPQMQEPEPVLMQTASEVVASGCPTTLPVCHVSFMHNGTVIHTETVIQGYDCPDPVAAGAINAPYKAPTVSHTYEFSGWSRTEGGAAETGDEGTLFEEQPLDGFTLLEAYGLHHYPVGSVIQLVPGETYQVTWDGKPYFCKAIDVSEAMSGGIAIGNGSGFGYTGNGEPFIILATPDSTIFFAFDDATRHTVSITKGVGLNNIISDTVVYPSFTESIRYYDISFYDEGAQLLDTVPYAYGETPSYTAVKEGFISTGWIPELAPVTGNASYVAQWKQISAFADATWDEIELLAVSGKANLAFAVGDQKTIPITWRDGTVTDVVFEIIGLNHDDLADGSGKAGITLGSKPALYGSYFCGAIIDGLRDKGWSACNFRKALTNYGLSAFPEDVRGRMKDVRKISTAKYTSGNIALEETVDKLFVPSASEYFGDRYNTSTIFSGQGTQYERFRTASNRCKYSANRTTISTSYVVHGTRSVYKRQYMYHNTVESNGSAQYTGSSYHMCICFCI